jgi:uncharacterized protein (DUF885 family)
MNIHRRSFFGSAIFALPVLVLFVLGACDQKQESRVTATTEEPSPEDMGTDSDKSGATNALRVLADDVWADYLDESTYYRLQEGLPIERFENLTLEDYHKQLLKAGEYRSRLEEINKLALSGDDLITYEILAFQNLEDGSNDDDYWLTFDITAYQAPFLFQIGQQALQAQTLANEPEAQHYLNLVGELADMIDQLLAKVEGQVERGIYLPKPALPATRLTWEGLQNGLPSAIRVDEKRLDSLSADERTWFNEALELLIETRIVSGFDRLLSALGEDYEANAPENVGLSQYPNGLQVYKRLVRNMTTLNLSPEEIHQRGITAVQDISRRMEAIRLQLEFKGTAREFLQQLKTDPNYIAADPAEVEQRFMGYIDRIEPKLADYFKVMPKAPYGVKRLALAAEAGMTYGYYDSPKAADPVGYYYYNASNLPERSMVWAGSLIYHELLPGHHFHIATQAENEALQKFRQNSLDTAYTEGWAEYAASLAIEMGLYETPEELYGRYVGEMFLATRLVVDTGMNALGWSLEEAREYMSQYVIQSESEIASETLRYSTSIPAQALAYRIGYEKIWELRTRAEAGLGDSFDIRKFHDVVLSDGSKPLAVLEAKVDRYIALKLK